MVEIRRVERQGKGPFHRLYREDGTEIHLHFDQIEGGDQGVGFARSAKLADGEYWLAGDALNTLVVFRVDASGGKSSLVPILSLEQRELDNPMLRQGKLAMADVPGKVIEVIEYYIEHER